MQQIFRSTCTLANALILKANSIGPLDFLECSAVWVPDLAEDQAAAFDSASPAAHCLPLLPSTNTALDSPGARHKPESHPYNPREPRNHTESPWETYSNSYWQNMIMKVWGFGGERGTLRNMALGHQKEYVQPCKHINSTTSYIMLWLYSLLEYRLCCHEESVDVC